MAIGTIKSLRICITQDGVIEVRIDKIFTDDTDGSTASQSTNGAFTPDTDPATLPAGRIRQIANLLWTPAVVQAWIAAHPPVAS